MMESILNDALRVIVFFSGIFNFALLAFFYRREPNTPHKMAFAVSALLVAVGQISFAVNAMHCSTVIEWPTAGMQIGLSIAIGYAAGSMKKAMSQFIKHN